MHIEETTTRFGRGDPAQAERGEHGRRVERSARALRGKFAGHLGAERGVTHLQVLVTDLLTARHQAERERNRIEAGVALGVLEPHQAVLGRLLDPFDHRPALGLVGFDRGHRMFVTFARSGEADGVFHRQLRSRTD